MKFRLTKSFLYSLFLHVTVVVLVVLLVMMTRDEEVVQQKRCKVMMSQVCHCMPEKDLVKKPVVEKAKRPSPLKKVVKKKPVKKVPKPVVKNEVLVKESPKVIEKVVEEVSSVESEPIEHQQEAVEEEPKKELIVTPDSEVALSTGAKQAIDAPPAEDIKPEDAYVKAHITEIMALLRKNLYYPRMARKRGIQGRVLVRFELLKNGDIQNIEVMESERDILARSAVTTIERLEGKFPLPDETLVLNVPIMYHLN